MQRLIAECYVAWHNFEDAVLDSIGEQEDVPAVATTTSLAPDKARTLLQPDEEAHNADLGDDNGRNQGDAAGAAFTSLDGEGQRPQTLSHDRTGSTV